MKLSLLRTTASCLLLSAAMGSHAAETPANPGTPPVGDDWPQWRGGPARTGAVTNGPTLASTWPTNGPPLVWKAALPVSTSPGNVSVARRRAYVSQAELSPTQQLVGAVYCLDAADGAVLWRRELGTTAPGWIKPGATPAVADGRVYVVHGPATDPQAVVAKAKRTGVVEVRCLDAATGQDVWQATQTVSDTALTMHGGPFSSPLVADGVCVVQYSGVVAYEAGTGRRLWDQPFVAGAHASPAVWQSPSGPHVLCRSSGTTNAVDESRRSPGIHGLDLKTGKPLWTLPGPAFLWGGPTPAIAGNVLVDLYGTGIAAFDLTGEKPRELWRQPVRGGVGHYGPSAAIVNGLICVPTAVALTFYRQDNGELAGTLPEAAGPSRGIFASACAVDGKFVYSVAVRGRHAAPDARLFLVQAGPPPRILAQAEVKGLLDHASPTIAGGRLFLRVNDGVVCFDLRTERTRQ